MSIMQKLKHFAGTCLKDVPRCVSLLSQPTVPGQIAPWVKICNRNEVAKLKFNDQGAACHWDWTSELFACKSFPSLGRKLFHRVFSEWQMVFAPGFEKVESPKLSVIIPQRGTERLPLLNATLKSWAAQKNVAGNIECLVVEQAIVPTPHPFPEHTRHVHLPMQHAEEPFRKSLCYNLGVTQARGEIVVCHDGDIPVPERFAEEILRRFEDAQLEALFSQRFLFYLNSKATQQVLDTGRLVDGIESIKQNWRGGTLAIRKTAYEKVGGFDERFVDWGGEDDEFFDRCLALNCDRHGYIPFIHLWHTPQPTKSGAARARHIQIMLEQLAIPREQRIAALLKSRPS